MEATVLEDIKAKVEQIEAEGHGEVVIKIKNGYVWRILDTHDTIRKKDLTNNNK